MTPLKNIRLINLAFTLPILLIVIFVFMFYQSSHCGRDSGKIQNIPSESELLDGKRIKYTCWGKMKQVTGIILHYTATKDFQTAMDVMEKRNLFVQIMIDKNGEAYQLTDNLDDFSAGATGGNSWGINIEIVGTEKSLEQSARQNDTQFVSVVNIIKFLTDYYQIPINNQFDPNQKIWQGIFSHKQVDNFHPNGGRNNKIDPGDSYMTAILQALTKD